MTIKCPCGRYHDKSECPDCGLLVEKKSTNVELPKKDINAQKEKIKNLNKEFSNFCKKNVGNYDKTREYSIMISNEERVLMSMLGIKSNQAM
jgi:hypothetical protein